MTPSRLSPGRFVPVAGRRDQPSQCRHVAATALSLAMVSLLGAAGCWSEQADRVVVYTALDSGFSEPIFEQFNDKTGLSVAPRFDTEATKTVGLTEAILAERKRPRCDVFWNNEILNTLRLQREGLLMAYDSPAAEPFPAQFRSPKNEWFGFAARARVLIVNTDVLAEGERPSSILDLADPKWRGRAGIAKPLFGTTASHAACLFAFWGDERAKQYFRDLKANDVQILAGNKQVALSVASGQLAFGMTDTDDAIIEKEKGMPVEIVYPDQGEGQMGTLFIPNTVAIIRGSQNVEAAQRLVDYLLSPEVEAALAAGRSAQIPLNPHVEAEVRVPTPKTMRAMDIDFEQAAAKWDAAAEFIRDEFTGG